MDTLSYVLLHSVCWEENSPISSRPRSRFLTKLGVDALSILLHCEIVLFSTAFHRCSMEFMSGENGGHLSCSTLSFFNQFLTIAAASFVSLWCWNAHCLSIFSLFTDWNRFFCMISRIQFASHIFINKNEISNTSRRKKSPNISRASTIMFNRWKSTLWIEFFFRWSSYDNRPIRSKQVEFTFIEPKHMIPETKRFFTISSNILKTFTTIDLVYVRIFTSNTTIQTCFVASLTYCWFRNYNVEFSFDTRGWFSVINLDFPLNDTISVSCSLLFSDLYQLYF